MVELHSSDSHVITRRCLRILERPTTPRAHESSVGSTESTSSRHPGTHCRSTHSSDYLSQGNSRSFAGHRSPQRCCRNCILKTCRVIQYPHVSTTVSKARRLGNDDGRRTKRNGSLFGARLNPRHSCQANSQSIVAVGRCNIGCTPLSIRKGTQMHSCRSQCNERAHPCPCVKMTNIAIEKMRAS